MPITSPEKIITPAPDDAYALTTDLRRMMASARTIVPVANATERAAVVSALVAAGTPPTAARPLFVYRADAPFPLEWTEDGTTWQWAGPTSGRGRREAGQGQITTVVAVTGLSATVKVRGGQRVKVSFLLRTASTAAADVVQVAIAEGATPLSIMTFAANAANNAGSTNTISGSTVVENPTAGEHTYSLTIARVVGSGTITINASASGPSELVAEVIGAAA